MNLATRCPSCGTVFRVVLDQLRVSEGWVRCGRCDNVFNAAEVLFDIDNGAPVHIDVPVETPPPDAADTGSEPTVSDWTAPPAPPSPSAPPPPRFQDGATPGQQPADPAWQHGNVPPTAAAGWPPERQEPAFDTGSTWSAPARSEPGLGPAEQAWSDGRRSGFAQREEPLLRTPSLPPAGLTPEPEFINPPAPASGSPLLARLALAPRPAPSRPAALADVTVAPPLPSFLRAADHAALWRRPAVRSALGLAVVLLAAGLLLQCALLWRDTLAARVPATEPALRSLCRLVGCQVQPLRRIDALAVDSSGLNRLQGSTLYRLQLVLHNRADTAVLAPALELSLTDAKGKLVARRVLALTDLGAPQSVLQAGQELPIKVLMATGERQVDGYTVELFYP